MFRVFFALVNLGYLVWMISAVAGTGDVCAGETGEMLEACEAGAAVGGFASMALILFLWMATDIIIYVIHRIFRRKDRGPKRTKVAL